MAQIDRPVAATDYLNFCGVDKVHSTRNTQSPKEKDNEEDNYNRSTDHDDRHVG
jgi:hypothetical protein